MMRLHLDLNSVEDYQTFLRIKSLPSYRFVGREAIIPDEYAGRLGIQPEIARYRPPYIPSPFLFDYQAGVSTLAIAKQKFGMFIRPGMGKTLCIYEFMKYALSVLPENRCGLIVAPLMVVRQMIKECERFYGDTLPIEQVKAAKLANWMVEGESRLGITNWEALDESVPQGRLGALVIDESQMLKSAYGKYGGEAIRLGRCLEWKLSSTGTPAPNDRIEFANQAVFLDAFPTVNSFLARFFVNRGQTDNRWELKPHALEPFYRALSHFSIFLSDPAVYGWSDNAGGFPPIHVHIHDVELTDQQSAAARETTGYLLPIHAGGITKRSKLAQIAKGTHNGEKIDSNKLAFIRELVASWPNESTIIWCRFNPEQEMLAKAFPEAANVTGTTPMVKREVLIEDFLAGRRKLLLSKAKILGLGQNYQIATRQIFSSLHDSYEEYFQAIMRSNRVGSTHDLNVHIPTTDLERPMIDNVLRKAHNIDEDTRFQERIFSRVACF